MLKDPTALVTPAMPSMPSQDEPQGPAVVAATPATAAALASRNEAIRNAIAGKNEPGRTSPRKF